MSLAWSPDSTKIVVGNNEKNITEAEIWDIINGTSVMKLSGKEEGFNAVAWSHDGKFITLLKDEGIPNRGIFEIWGEVSSIIRFVSFSCDRAELEIGENLSCIATIRNYGSLDGTNQSLRFYIDNDSLSERLFNIPTRGTVEQTLELNISNDTKPGQHILKAKLNSDEKEFPVIILVKPVISKPNIYIKNIMADRKVVIIGQIVFITTTLGNNGTADSPYTLCTLFHESNELNATHLMVKQNSSESYLFKLDTKDLKTGNYTIKAITDNQSKAITITIKAKVETTVIPNVFCPIITLMIIIITIIVALYSKKQRTK